MEQAHGEADPSSSPGARRDPMKHHKVMIDQILSEEDPDWSKLYPYIIQPDLDPNRVSSETKLSTLHRCAYAGEPRILKWCLAREVEVDAKTTLGRTALHFACDANSTECVRLLVEAQADPNATTLSGSTPLHLCCQTKSYDAMMQLFGANQIILLDAEDSRRKTPEMLTSDAEMLEGVQSYRANMDTLRSALLVKEVILALLGKQSKSLLGYIFSSWHQEAKNSQKVPDAEGGYHEPSSPSAPAPPKTAYVPAYAMAINGSTP